MGSLLQDLRYGARMLRRNPGFTLIAALTLGLGIGANTAIFSFVNSIFLRPLAVTNPEQVIRLYAEDLHGSNFDVFSYPNYADLRDQERGQAFYQQLVERLKSLPGVRAVTFATVVPLGTGRDVLSYRIPGHVTPNGDPYFPIADNNVGPDYFATMGIPILRGRGFNAGDAQPGARPVAIINETMARRFWPNADAVGQSIQSGENSPPIEIIGVARDIKYYSLAEEPQPYVYTNASKLYAPYQTLHLRTAGDPKTMGTALRKEVERLDPHVAITQLTTFAELRQEPLFPSRAMAIVASLFGLLALLLAAVGIYGITSYAVGQRTREIGIRIALGAERGDIFRLIFAQGVGSTLVGVGVGVATALALTRFLSSQLFGVSAHDPLTFAEVALLLTFVALMACWIPARRAMKVDPLVALKYE